MIWTDLEKVIQKMSLTDSSGSIGHIFLNPNEMESQKY